MKKLLKRVSPIAAALLAVVLLTACASEPPRVLTLHSYSPGASFVANYDPEDLRRQIKCSVTFEVIDEEAIEELTVLNYRVRYSVLSVLCELSIDEITKNRDLDAIAHRIAERVNSDLPTGEDIHLVSRAFITEFEIL